MKLLLTIYVDDLLLSGPEKNHYPFWRTLEKDVEIEPEEDLDSFNQSLVPEGTSMQRLLVNRKLGWITA